jgi:hypothetical protein
VTKLDCSSAATADFPSDRPLSSNSAIPYENVSHLTGNFSHLKGDFSNLKAGDLSNLQGDLLHLKGERSVMVTPAVGAYLSLPLLSVSCSYRMEDARAPWQHNECKKARQSSLAAQ